MFTNVIQKLVASILFFVCFTCTTFAGQLSIGEFLPGTHISIVEGQVIRDTHASIEAISRTEYVVEGLFGDKVTSVFVTRRDGVIESIDHRVNDKEVIDTLSASFTNRGAASVLRGSTEEWYVGDSLWQIVSGGSSWRVLATRNRLDSF